MAQTLKEKLGYKHQFHITLQVSEEDQCDVTIEDSGEIELHKVTLLAHGAVVRNSISFTPELFEKLMIHGPQVIEEAERIKHG